MHKMVVSILGPDRPGIIAAVTQCLLEVDGNIENVAQTILQSEFSGTFIALVPESVTLSILGQKMNRAMEDLGMRVFVKKLTEPDGESVVKYAEQFVITTRGPDRKGLVAAITAVIAGFGVNVTNLQAVFKGGDDPNRNIMIYEVELPEGIDMEKFTMALRERAAELNLKISIQHRDVFKAINRV